MNLSSKVGALKQKTKEHQTRSLESVGEKSMMKGKELG
jgi:hypothetical protein